MKRADIYQQVTDKIIAAIEKGGLANWTKPWARLGVTGGALPWNFLTGKQYRGMNVVMLMMAAYEQGYTSNAWVTFKQARELGGNVRKGETGTTIIAYRQIEVTEEGKEAGSEDAKYIPMIKGHTVFNVCQCEGLEGLEAIEPVPLLDEAGKLEKVAEIRNRLIQETGLSYARVGDRACYMPTPDRVQMPAGEWESVDAFCATELHELTHATGAAHRLGRHAVLAKRFSTKEDEATFIAERNFHFKNQQSRKLYAMEELCAELGSMMLCAELGIVSPEQDEQHAAYIDSWLSAMRGDKTYIFKAATLASQAHVYLMGEVEEEQKAAAETSNEESDAA